MALERLVFIGFVIVSIIFVVSTWYNIVQNIFQETTTCLNKPLDFEELLMQVRGSVKDTSE